MLQCTIAYTYICVGTYLGSYLGRQVVHKNSDKRQIFLPYRETREHQPQHNNILPYRTNIFSTFNTTTFCGVRARRGVAVLEGTNSRARARTPVISSLTLRRLLTTLSFLSFPLFLPVPTPSSICCSCFLGLRLPTTHNGRE